MTTPYQQQGAAPAVPPQAPPQPPGPGPAVGGYASPLPVHRTHLGGALASEWTKIRTVRSTMWTLGIMFTLVVGVGFLTALGLNSSDTAQMPLLAGGLFGLMLGQICIITLGVLVITSEYSTGMIRTTLTASPPRSRVLAAKAIVFFLLSFVMTTAATGLTALINSSMLSGKPAMEYAEIPKESISGGEVVASGSEWLGATVGAGLYVALLGLLSLAVGAMLRHSAGAITTMLGVVLLPLLLALFMVTESLESVRDKLIEYSPLNGLASLYRIPMDGGDGTGWDLLWVLAGVTAAALVGAFALLEKRDV
ncbi:ABC transporter permease [Streptomyces sp. 7N604]|uniref:ABC transporter permease n=1 Tax=Streptomyces sp. 7N604 TaxID=3457415 RepID=UPI003FD3FBEF